MGEHVMENSALRVTVSDAGAELISVVDKEKQTERIWTGKKAIWNRHAPILFPFVGKVNGGKYRIAGREYEMKTQHGFARDLDFTCIEDTPGSVKHRLTATDWTRERYPYDFCLTVAHSLAGWQLNVSWEIENRGEDRMYYCIGGHPGFLMPQGIRKEDCRILFPGRETLRYKSANSNGYILPEEKTLRLRDESAAWQEDIPDTWIFEDGQVKSVGLLLPDGSPWVMLRCEAFPMLAVWANAAGPFICLEPWFGRADDEGFRGSIEEKKAIEHLEAGEKKTICYSMEFI